MEYMSSAKMRPVVQYYLRKHKGEVRVFSSSALPWSLSRVHVAATLLDLIDWSRVILRPRRSRTGQRCTASATSQVRRARWPIPARVLRAMKKRNTCAERERNFLFPRVCVR